MEGELLQYRILEQQSGSETVEDGNPTDAVVFFGICLVLGIASRHLLRGTRVPYTVALLIIGIALGSLGLSHFRFYLCFMCSVLLRLICV